MGQTGLKGNLVRSRVFLTVIGVLYASQMVRPSVRARVSFHLLDIALVTYGEFCYDAWLIRGIKEETRWDNSGVSIFGDCVWDLHMLPVLDVTLGGQELLTKLA